jgi:cellulose synthase/poly-beta-1,6-N-acetylglucosamine synthase-like glycosyltransferase
LDHQYRAACSAWNVPDLQNKTIHPVMEIFFSILSLAYLILLILFFISWKKIRFDKSAELIPSTFISVVVAVRNEEKNIAKLLEDLNAQTYPASLFEVLIIDDHSTDSTTEIVRSYISKAKFSLVCDTSGESANGSYKKKAIQAGVEKSKGTLIVTTDGDCRVGSEWLSTIENFYRQTGAKFISSPVNFFKGEGLFKEMQSVEFASLIGSGAACLNMGIPNMCNGANIAYEKKVFIEVNGFQGNEHVPSGDDEFLMHKIFRKYPDKVMFLKTEAAMVFTEAKETLSEFISQRKRWASKWGSYTYINIKVLAFFIFLYNLSLLIAGSLVIAGKYSLVLLLLQLSPKILLEALFLSDILRLSLQRLNFFLFLLMQLFYPFYIVIVALTSRLGGYSWKGRKIMH